MASSDIEGFRVLGIDASLRSTGLAVVEARGTRLSAVAQNTLKTTPSMPLSECLSSVFDGVEAMAEETGARAAAIEGGFFHRNVKTAMVLGAARGVAIAACARCGLPVFEYEPRRVKQSVVGYGAAGKEQVRKMVVTLLNLSTEPQEDAGDALALAICHLHTRSSHGVLMPKTI